MATPAELGVYTHIRPRTCAATTGPAEGHTRGAAVAARMACLFCKIAAGEIPSEKVGENGEAFAFLDIRPLARGHVLVVPKRHAERFGDMSPAAAHAVAELAQEVARRQQTGLGAQGATIAVNDGRAAGQEVMHVHVHVVPRREDDGFGPIHGLFEPVELRPGELQEIGLKLRG